MSSRPGVAAAKKPTFGMVRMKRQVAVIDLGALPQFGCEL